MTKQIYPKLLVVLVFLSAAVLSQNFPISPCPDYFKYVNQNGQVEGLIKLPFTRSTSLDLAVNASMKGWHGKKGSNMKITLLTPGKDLFSRTAQFVEYQLQFPTQAAIPRITHITLNGQVFCKGPPEPLLPGRPVTNMVSFHKISFVAATVLHVLKPSVLDDDDFYVEY